MTRPAYFSDDEIERLLTQELALESQRSAFSALGNDEAVLAPRVLIDGADDSVAFSYVARLSPQAPVVSKFGSVNPVNAERNEPVISATVHMLDAVSGRPVATLEATNLTTLRTAAASALVCEQLAREDARTLGVIGSGVQARAHIHALTRVRNFEEVRVAGRSLERAKAMARELAAEIDVPVRVVGHELVAAADVVVTCTTSFEAVLETAWVRPGATVISVGAFAPDRMELPTSLIDRADLVVVDHLETTSAQSGPVVAALESGSIGLGDLVELGTVVTGKHPGRTNPREIIVYFSVGIGIQDAAAAAAVVAAADGVSAADD
ncbi:ornithine cyclodeaminase family protein [Gulosibacter macacae]|uniref:Ornithine cyclodeaminase family protein n=1 Tax=Gulosibacter macacae TaxID=2488791 RepID=A0A3P3VZK7_9MICO|nr:ornithine cyclodeaminase family protein [Gulosibacter macacae]RRJ87934.1 ornithine cyclodeaminase family protein [Gulosibacter macacae]